MSSIINFSFTGPSDDWDPQGYTDEEEDVLAPGMHFMEEEVEPDALLVEEEVIGDEVPIEADSEEEDEESFELVKDPIKELDDLAQSILKNEHETLKYSDFSDDE